MTKEQMLAIIEAIKTGRLDYIQELLDNHTDWLFTHLMDDYDYESLAIHYASKYGQLDVINMLLNKDPSLLNRIDNYGQTPIFLAAAHGHAHIVAYFITENADLNIAINRQGHADHGKTPLIKAIEGMHHETANVLILKITANQNENAILPFVQTGEQALELMVLDPRLINVLLQDSRIIRLISIICHISPQSINWYKHSGRRPSWFLHIDRNKKTTSLFKPVKELGEGSYGIVRLFKTADGQEIGVKSLKKPAINLSPEERRDFRNELNKEVLFNKQAYPDGNFFKSFEFDFSNINRKIYTNRYVMPYVKGETAWELIPKTTCPRQLAKITLQIAQELQRIHDVGIIHGDLGPKNIMIHCGENKTIIVRLIDFGCSYYLTDTHATLWEPSAKGTWLPPEICNEKKEYIKPHPNQDVYALGYSLQLLLNANRSYQELIRLFPSINAFILAAQDIDPMARPSLISFYKQLDNELNPKTEEHAPLPQKRETCRIM